MIAYLLIFFIVAILVFIGGFLTGKLMCKCVKEEVIYRYIPRKILDQQYDEAVGTDLHKAMFTEADTWSYWMDYDKRKKEDVNKYFISQL